MATASSVMLLEERELLSIVDKFSSHFPEFTRKIKLLSLFFLGDLFSKHVYTDRGSDKEQGMAIKQAHQQYGLSEEIANSVIHGIGIILSIVGLTSLLILSTQFATAAHFISYLIYGISLILLYTSSTLYHALPSEKAKKFFKICDHSAIYLLIAGTYTPFLVINLKGQIGDLLLVIIWSIAIVGVVFKFFFTGRFKLLSTLLYIGMGWLIIFAAKPLSIAIGESGMNWLIIGGLTYTLGAIFYLLKKIPYTHAIWHLFVLMGSIFHFVAVVHSANFSS